MAIGDKLTLVADSCPSLFLPATTRPGLGFGAAFCFPVSQLICISRCLAFEAFLPLRRMFRYMHTFLIQLAQLFSILLV